MSFFPSGFHAVGHRRTRWGTRPYKLEIFRDWPAVSKLEGDWKRLTAIHPDPVPSICWEAIYGLRTIGLERGVPLVVGIRMDDRIEGIFPFVALNWAGGLHLRFLGGRLLTRHEPLLTPEVRLVPAALILKRIARLLGRRVLFDLTGLRPGGFGADWLRQSLSGATGWYGAQGARETTLDLSGGWESVRVRVPRSLLREAETARECLRGYGGLDLRFLDAPEPADIETLYLLARGRGRFPDSRAGRVLWELMSGALAKGRLRIGQVFIGQELAAATSTWVLGGQAVELFRAESGRHAGLAPATVMRVAGLEYLASDPSIQDLRLQPGSGDARLLSPIPQYQGRFWGAPFPGLARLAAQFGGWQARNRELCDGPLRWMRSLMKPLRHAQDEATELLREYELSTPERSAAACGFRAAGAREEESAKQQV